LGGTDSGKTTGGTINFIIYADGYSANDFYNTSTGKLQTPTTEPTKEGYDFTGWYTDENCENALEAGTEPKAGSTIKIYAGWKVAEIKVTIYDEYNGTSEVGVDYGKKFIMSEPTYDGYTFDGWYTDANCTKEYNAATLLQEDTDIYVKWKYAVYTVTYESNGGIFGLGNIPIEYTLANAVTLPEPEKDGYEFEGWYEDALFSGGKITEISGTTGNKIYYAKYFCLLAYVAGIDGKSEVNGSDAAFWISRLAGDVKLSDYLEFSQNAAYTVTDFENVEDSDGVIPVTENTDLLSRSFDYTLTVTAEKGGATKTYSLTLNQYGSGTVDVKYYVGAEIDHTDTYNKGEFITEYTTAAEAPEGYEFAFWSKDGVTEYAFNMPVSEDTALHAEYKTIAYTVTYSLGRALNSADNPATYTIESDITLKNASAPDGYTFDGWYKDASYTEKITRINAVFGELTLYAGYIKNLSWTYSSNAGGEYEITKAQYADFVSYVIFNDILTPKLKISGMASDTAEEVKTEIQELFRLVDTPYKLSVIYNYDETAKILTETLTMAVDAAAATKKSSEGAYTQKLFVDWSDGAARGENYTDFAVDHILTTMAVNTGEELFYALEQGFRPVCANNSAAYELYGKARFALNNTLAADATDREKVIAVAEYLVNNVAYDNYVLSHADASDILSYDAFYLEGVFDDGVAVCDGISKAFSVLCRIEGISAIQVNGELNNSGHAWNKVYIDTDGDGDEEWSAVDCTAANALANGEEYMNHGYIFLTDETLDEKGYVYDSRWYYSYGGVNVMYYEAKSADKYNIYKAAKFTYDNAEYDFFIETESELRILFEYYKTLYDAEKAQGEEISVDFCLSDSLESEISGAAQDAGMRGVISKIKTEGIAQTDGYDVYIVYYEI
jgi:uncharacterized repeat protein (TIGR02543 family)